MGVGIGVRRGGRANGLARGSEKGGAQLAGVNQATLVTRSTVTGSIVTMPGAG